MKYRIYTKKDPLLKVDRPCINGKYHVDWGHSNGVVGIVKQINIKDRTVIMISPKSRLTWKKVVKWEDLRHLRKVQLKIENKQNESKRLSISGS